MSCGVHPLTSEHGPLEEGGRAGMRRRRHALALRVALLHACRTPSVLFLVLTIPIIMSPLQSVISSSTEQIVQAPTVTAQSTPSVSTTTIGPGFESSLAV